MMKSTIFAIAAFMAATSLQAQSLADVLGSVERNNTELKAILKGNEAAHLDLKQANNLEGLSVEYSPFFNSAVSGIASSELVVTQGFDFPTLYGARRKAARLQGEAIDMQYRTARRDVLLGAKQLCLDLIHMNKRRALLDERRRAADELLAMYTEKYDGGEATVIELNKVKMERMNLETELASAENDRAAALQQLRAMNGGEPIECTDTLYPLLPAGGDEAMYAQAVSADLPAMAAAASVKAAEQDVKVSRQGWMPKLEIGYRRNTDGTDASNGFLIGGSIPLFANR
ncbi:MAG TPA: TolC family protein, partial [Candidatus Prevotella stercoripullorum]|nr:TolC family protein [Candidatus Prevotella stercoripullorum]